MAERMIDVSGVEVCTEPFGDPADRPILLVQGVGASMLWWDEGFCRMLSDAGRFVIRYDHVTPGGRSRTSQGTPATPARTWWLTWLACSTPTGSAPPTSSASRRGARSHNCSRSSSPNGSSRWC